MSGLKMFCVLAIACVLAACNEFPTEPMNADTPDVTLAKAPVREMGVAGISEFHAEIVGPDSVLFRWKATGRFDGVYLKRVGVNYVATYPPPFPVITDPAVTSVVVGGFAPGNPIGLWELIQYIDGTPQEGRIFMKGVTLHPKEAAMRTSPGTPTNAWAEAVSVGSVRYSWKRNPPLIEDGFELYDNDRQIAIDVPKGATSYTLTGLVSKTIVPGGNDKNTMRLRAFVVLENGNRLYTPELTGFPWVQVR